MILHELMAKGAYNVESFGFREGLSLLKLYPCVYYTARNYSRAARYVYELNRTADQHYDGSLNNVVHIRRLGRRVLMERGPKFNAEHISRLATKYVLHDPYSPTMMQRVMDKYAYASGGDLISQPIYVDGHPPIVGSMRPLGPDESIDDRVLVGEEELELAYRIRTGEQTEENDDDLESLLVDEALRNAQARPR